MSEVIIRAEKVSKQFHEGEILAVEDFSLEIHRNEVVTVVGPSGCGKSTFLNMVAGFIRPSSGHIFLEDKEITSVEPRCGMVFQSYALFPWLTILANVSLGPRLKGVPKAERLERARYWINRVGLEGFENAYPAQLSGGMQQRVALARVLANQPEILLCDEPFAALDAMTRQLMQQELLRLVRDSSQTVLFITHSIEEALMLSDRIVVMSTRPGRIKAIHENHLPQPRTIEMQSNQMFVEMKKIIWTQVEEEVIGSLSRGRV